MLFKKFSLLVVLSIGILFAVPGVVKFAVTSLTYADVLHNVRISEEKQYDLQIKFVEKGQMACFRIMQGH